MPRIYVADLAAYNAASLVGRWFDPADFDYDADELRVAVSKMLEQFGHEEWAIHDFEGFEGISLSEYESFDRVCALAQGIDEHGAEFAVFVRYFMVDTGDIESLVDQFQDAYIGEMSAEDYAYEYVNDCLFGEIPESVRKTVESYFDYEKFGRDMVLGGDVVEVDGFLFNGAW